MAFKFKCNDCGKIDSLRYKAYWYRKNKGTGKCDSCSKKGGNSTSFIKGMIPWNKGLKGFMLGVPKWFPSGNKNPAWKGGITSSGMKIRNSRKYAEWRKKVFERDNYICQECRQKGGKLCADHIKPFSLFPELRLNLSNGRTLCFDCHKLTDTYLSKIHIYATKV